jgi:hypothetical protein
MEKMDTYKYDGDYKINTITKKSPDDFFISCISYEPRTLGSLKKFDNNYHANHGIFILNETFKDFEKVRENKTWVDNYIIGTSFFDTYQFVLSSLENPIKILIAIDKILKEKYSSNNNVTITLDITTFPRGELLKLLYYLRHQPNISKIRILYISPEEYGDWLTQGYRYSIIPPFFEGPPTFDKKTALCLLTGFEYERAISLIDDIEPSSIIIGNPSPGTADKFKEISDEIIGKIRKSRRISNEIIDVPANDPFQCKKYLNAYLQTQKKDYNFYIAPMGSKLETIGLYLLYEENPFFRIIYPLPMIYNIGNYSKGMQDIYAFLLHHEPKNVEGI